jgi:hypothetical protein
VAVVTNSLPYPGVTLPLVSFGGSSTVISLLAIGLLLNISRQPTAAALEDEPAFEAESRPKLPQRAAPVLRTRVPVPERRGASQVQVAPLRARLVGRRTRGVRRV